MDLERVMHGRLSVILRDFRMSTFALMIFEAKVPCVDIHLISNTDMEYGEQ